MSVNARGNIDRFQATVQLSYNLRSGVPIFFLAAGRNAYLPAAKNKGTPDRMLAHPNQGHDK